MVYGVSLSSTKHVPSMKYGWSDGGGAKDFKVEIMLDMIVYLINLRR